MHHMHFCAPRTPPRAVSAPSLASGSLRRLLAPIAAYFFWLTTCVPSFFWFSTLCSPASSLHARVLRQELRNHSSFVAAMCISSSLSNTLTAISVAAFTAESPPAWPTYRCTVCWPLAPNGAVLGRGPCTVFCTQGVAISVAGLL